MSIKSTLNEQIKNAMKAGQKDRLQVLRMMLSEIKYAQANSGNVHEDLAESEEIKIISTYHKRLEKSLGDYPEGPAREKIKTEMIVVEEFLPKKASSEEMSNIISEVLAGTSERQFGPLMKLVMAKLGNSADGKQLSAILKEKLANL